jgi:hypothetical protein
MTTDYCFLTVMSNSVIFKFEDNRMSNFVILKFLHIAYIRVYYLKILHDHRIFQSFQIYNYDNSLFTKIWIVLLEKSC